MSYWTTIENPPQELLDKLMAERTKNKRSCPDCGAKIGAKHIMGCDVARCTVCGEQDLSCGCKRSTKKTMETWTGIWPGVQTAYDKKLVCYGPDKVPIFDLNEVARLRTSKRVK